MVDTWLAPMLMRVLDVCPLDVKNQHPYVYEKALRRVHWSNMDPPLDQYLMARALDIMMYLSSSLAQHINLVH